MTRKKLLILLGSVCLALVLVVPAAAGCAGPAPTPTPTPAKPTPTPTPTPAPPPKAAETYTWEWGAPSPAADIASWATDMFADLVEERSHGRIHINVHYGGEIVKAPELLDACGRNVLAGMWTGYCLCTGLDPVFNVGNSLPYAGTDQLMEVALWEHEGFGELFGEILAENHNVYLLRTATTSRHMLFSNRAIRAVSDFKGLKVRASGPEASFLEKLGASPLTVAGGEVYTALQLGTIDAATWLPNAWEVNHFNEVAEYYCLPQLQNCNLPLCINLDVWNSLSEDLQYVLLWSSHDWALYNLSENYTYTTRVENSIMKNEPERMIWLPPEEQEKMRQVAFEVWDEIAAESPKCAEAVAIYRGYLKKIGITD